MNVSFSDCLINGYTEYESLKHLPLCSTEHYIGMVIIFMVAITALTLIVILLKKEKKVKKWKTKDTCFK